ncbi:MAG: sugar phosphate isomerase/epimerase family protein [Bacteroidales bacterium]
MSKIPVGLQLYSVREDCARDLPGTLKAIQKMGYVGVEFAGYHGYSASDLRKMLDDLGLQCCGAHIGLDQLLGDALPKTVEIQQTLKNPFVVVPWLTEDRRNSAKAWVETAHLFNEISARLKPYGLRLGYHNHNIEFVDMDGSTGFDLFFGNTNADVILQFDIGNAMDGGAEPMPCIKRYPHRHTTIHLKDFSPTDRNVLVGKGIAPWKEIFDFCETEGDTTWYIVEQSFYPMSPIDSVAACIEALREMGKV